MFVTIRVPAATAAATLFAALVSATPAMGQAAFTATRTVPVVRIGDDASQLFEGGRLGEARAAYERTTRDARARQEYAKDAFTGLANVQFALDDLKGAARTLDELGVRAGEFGDPETEITAFLKSALLFAQAGDGRSAALRVPRLKTLLQSPVISDETRRFVANRIGK
jgi:hypothetical protein